MTSTVKCKRNYSEYTLPYKSTPVSKQKTIVQNTIPNQEQNSKKEQDLHENVYIYREGTIPPSRQMFYQVYYNFIIFMNYLYILYFKYYILNIRFFYSIVMFLWMKYKKC